MFRRHPREHPRHLRLPQARPIAPTRTATAAKIATRCPVCHGPAHPRTVGKGW